MRSDVSGANITEELLAKGSCELGDCDFVACVCRGRDPGWGIEPVCMPSWSIAALRGQRDLPDRSQTLAAEHKYSKLSAHIRRYKEIASFDIEGHCLRTGVGRDSFNERVFILFIFMVHRDIAPAIRHKYEFA